MSEKPQKPGASGAPQPQPTSRKQRPAAPAPREETSAAAPPEPRMQIVDDDDAVMIPELAPERLASTSLYGSTRADASAGGGARSLFFRRTMIPILLTCGAMFPALAALWFSTDLDHVVRRTGRWLPVTLVVLGAVFLLLGVVNMAQVRHLMAQRKASPTPR